MSVNLTSTLSGHTDRIWTVCWSPDGSFLASSGADKSIRLWNESHNGWTCCSVLTKAHSQSIRRICWSPCGLYLAAASFDSTTSIWKKNPQDNSWSSVVDLDGHDNEVKSVAWSSDGCYLATCGRDRTIWIWEKSSADVEDETLNWDCSDIKNDHSKDVKHIVWHPTHNILVSCSYDETIKFFHKEKDEWKCYQTLTSHTSTVWSADFSKSGEYLVSCSDDKTIRVWLNHSHKELPKVKSDSWRCISVTQGYHTRTIYDVSWSHFHDVIASGSGDNAIAIYGKTDDLFSCIVKKSQSHECDVNTVAWNHKTGMLASGSDDHKIKLWTYQDDDKGMKVLTCEEEIMQKLINMSSTSSLSETCSDKLITNLVVNDFHHLLNVVQTLQDLQSEVRGIDEEVMSIKKLLHIDSLEVDLTGIEFNNVCFKGDGFTTSLTVTISKYHFNLLFNQDKYSVILPKRSVKFLLVAQELFLLEKTGDMYRVMDDGSSKFLLGHLFMFTDLKFLTKSTNKSHVDKKINFIISSDRDEKIRISNFPDTHNIQSFCFGHSHFIRRLIVVDSVRFISVDIKDNVLLWDISRIRELSEDEILKPVLTLDLRGSDAKRRRIGTASTSGLNKLKTVMEPSYRKTSVLVEE